MKRYVFLAGVWLILTLIVIIGLGYQDIYFILHPEEWQPVEESGAVYEYYLGQGALGYSGDYTPAQITPPTINSILSTYGIGAAVIAFIPTCGVYSFIKIKNGEV